MRLNKRVDIMKDLYETGMLSKDEVRREKQDYRGGLSTYLFTKQQEYENITDYYEYSQEEAQCLQELILNGEVYRYYTKEEVDVLMKSIDF